MIRNSERVRKQAEERAELEEMAGMFRQLLFAVAREHGRLRVRASMLSALHEDDRVDFVHHENGDIIVEYRGAK